jgi:glycosyltransferase involved in cell wall biosynthesis
MKIFVGDGNPFMVNIGREIGKLGVDIVSDPDAADVQIYRVRFPNVNAKTSVKRILRLDGIYFDRANVHKNAGIAASLAVADGVIYQSEFAKSMCDHFLGKPKTGVPWTIIHNGYYTDLPKREIDHPEIRKYDHVVLAVSKWRIFKRLPETIEAFVRANIEKSCLVIVGDTSKVRLPELPNNVFCLGKLNNEAIIPYYQNCSCFVHISWCDTCPNVVSEAMACGAWPIVGNTGGSRELVAKTGVGFVYNIDDDVTYDVYEGVDAPPMSDRSLQYIADAIREATLGGYWCEGDKRHIDIKHVANRYLGFVQITTF